ncbi:MAG: hypothetical protein ACREA0_20985 [bacterium]
MRKPALNWQDVASVGLALGLVTAGGLLIMRNGRFGVAFYLWLASTVAIAVAVYVRLRRVPKTPTASGQFRAMILIAVLMGFSAVSNGIIQAQSGHLGWAWLSTLQLVGAVIIGTYAVVRAQRGEPRSD